jgi:hypothetical protein
MRVAPERRLSEADARRLMTFVVEAMDGRRPLSQLTGVMGEDAVRELRVLPGRVRLGRVRLGRVRVCRVGGDAAEISGTVLWGKRVCAVAARVEHLRGGWVCVVFKVLL